MNTHPDSNYSGILLAVEGIDGAGKTTQVKMLAERLMAAGERVVVSKEPTDGQWGRKLRESAATGRLPLAEELELFIRDRQSHVDSLILPELRKGSIVILDRYYYSTIAYQGSRGASPEAITEKMAFAPTPDMTLILDAPPSVTLDRIASLRHETPNEFEKLESLSKCREVFLDLARSNDECYRVDATQSVEAIEKSILRLLLEHALLHKRCGKDYGCEVFFCSLRAQGLCQWAILKSKLDCTVT